MISASRFPSCYPLCDRTWFPQTYSDLHFALYKGAIPSVLRFAQIACPWTRPCEKKC
ncbi:MAG: hypothetical protein VKL59_22755 [Nostocaceae cyanobacterium]|nr:hypothetical protein [Nostocaceae cyanobacterium]